MIKAVFDTVIFVRSLINPFGRWGELVSKKNKYQLFVSQPIIEEYLEVLHRPELTSKFKSLLDLNLETIFELIGQATVIETPIVPHVSRDLKDNIFLATSSVGNADFLVSEDADLLDLKEYKGTKVVTALDFLHIL